MRVYTGHGTPLWLSPRANGGIIIMQGQNKLLLSSDELPIVLDAIDKITAEPSLTPRSGGVGGNRWVGRPRDRLPTLSQA